MKSSKEAEACTDRAKPLGQKLAPCRVLELYTGPAFGQVVWRDLYINTKRNVLLSDNMIATKTQKRGVLPSKEKNIDSGSGSDISVTTQI